MTNKKIIVPLLIISLLSSCLSPKNIKSFECSYSKNSGEPLSKSIALHPKITTTKGDILVPVDADTDQLIPSWQKKTSKSLKEYQISVNGGTRRYGTNIIDIDNTDPLKINKHLQVIISVKKKLSLADTIDIIPDYKEMILLNFDDQRSNGNADNVSINVQKIHDETYYNKFNCELYLVKIMCRNRSETFYMSEKESSIIIKNRGADGANGTHGASGTKGTKGKDGALGQKGKPGQDGGYGGNGGTGSNGGNGGKVTLTLDSASIEFQKIITIDCRRGFGGRGGQGGIGGSGGVGGKGGERIIDPGIRSKNRDGGASGSAGTNGKNGKNGLDGLDAPPIEVVIMN